MLITVIVTILILAVASLAIRILRLKLFLQKTVKKLTSLGYKVYAYPFMFPKMAVKQSWSAAQRDHHDGQYTYKTELSNYDIGVTNLLFQPALEVYDPKIFKQFFQKANNGNYVKNQFGLGHLQLSIGVQNLILSEESEWLERRDALNGAFTQDFIIRKIPKIQEITRTVLNKFQSQNEPNLECQIQLILNNIFGNVILNCFDKDKKIKRIQGKKTIQYIPQMINALNTAAVSGIASLGAMFGTSVAKKLISFTNNSLMNEIKTFRTEMRKLIINRIKQVKNNPQKTNKPEDLIQALVLNNQFDLQDVDVGNKEKKNTGKQVITVDNLINQLIVLFVADSTAVITKMSICLLADHPQVMQKVRQQIQREIKTDQITYEQLQNLKYLSCVQKEVLRMYSAIGTLFTRVAKKDNYLGDIQVHKGTAVMFRFRATHFRQNLYPSALQFKPQRWENKKLPDDYTYIPFSSGERKCFGMSLVDKQNKIVIIELLRRYKDIKTPKKVKDMLIQMKATYSPESVEATFIKND